MPCAAVQQLPHVRREACDWTVGGTGGEMLWFHSVIIGGSVLREEINYMFYFESCAIFKKNKI
jgi:hypothetical protein